MIDPTTSLCLTALKSKIFLYLGDLYIMKLLNAPLERFLIIKAVENDQIQLLLHGISPGEQIQIISKFKTQPLRIKVRETYLAIDRKLAMLIDVEPA